MDITNGDSVQDVSGLYGPGTFISWVLVALSALINARKHDARVGLDGEAIAAVTYPLVAALDAMYRSSVGDSGASLWAASRVSFGGMLLLAVGLYQTLHSPCASPRMPSAQRISAWAGAYYVCYAACLSCFRTTSRGHGGVYAGFLFPALAGLLDPMQYFVAFATFSVCVALSLEGPQWPFPRTGTRIGELDQAFSLAGTVVALAWQWRHRLSVHAARIAGTTAWAHGALLSYRESQIANDVVALTPFHPPPYACLPPLVTSPALTINCFSRLDTLVIGAPQTNERAILAPPVHLQSYLPR